MNPLAEQPRRAMAGGFFGARETAAVWRLARWRSPAPRGELESSDY